MAVIHGAIVFIKVNGQRLLKGTEFDPGRSMPTERSEVLGQYHPDEIIHMASYCQPSFQVEQVSGKSITALGIFPPQSTTEDILNHPALLLEVEDKVTGATLYRIQGFKANDISAPIRKGQITVYNVRGEGTLCTDDFEN